MANILMFMMVTVDGYFEGENHDISWHNVDQEFNDFAINQLNEAGTLLFGRKTYDLMASYWPTAYAIKDDPVVARMMNSASKIVFSNSLKEAKWENTRIINENVENELRTLKDKETKDMIIFGSSDLTVSLLKMNLVDELRLMINPIILGDGKKLFEGMEKTLSLKLFNSKVFKSGNILLYYRVL